MNCTVCGMPLGPEDKICTNCGNPVSALPTQESTAYGTPPSASTPSSHQSPIQGPQGYPPSNANVFQTQVRTLFALTMVFSLIAGIMLLVFDFGGWYNYDYYNDIREYGWVGPFVNQFSFIPFLLVAISLFFCSFISYQGFSSKYPFPRNIVMRGFIISTVVLVIILIGGAALFIATSEADSTWLEAGFYGGAIGSLLTSLCFGLILKNTPHVKAQKKIGYQAPPSAYPYQAPSTPPYGIQAAPTASPPLTQPEESSPSIPQPATSQAPETEVTEPTEGEAEMPPSQEEPKQEVQQQLQQEYQSQAQQPHSQPQQQYQPPQQQYPQQQRYQHPQQQYQQPYQQYPQQQYQQPQYPPQQTHPCPKCGQPIRFINEYRKWYCDNCRRYF